MWKTFSIIYYQYAKLTQQIAQRRGKGNSIDEMGILVR